MMEISLFAEDLIVTVKMNCVCRFLFCQTGISTELEKVVYVTEWCQRVSTSVDRGVLCTSLKQGCCLLCAKSVICVHLLP